MRIKKLISSVFLVSSIMLSLMPNCVMAENLAVETENPVLFSADFESGKVDDGGLQFSASTVEVVKKDAEYGNSLKVNSTKDNVSLIAMAPEAQKAPILIRFSFFRESDDSILLLQVAESEMPTTAEFPRSGVGVWQTFYNVNGKASFYNNMKGWAQSTNPDDSRPINSKEWHEAMVYLDYTHQDLHYYIDGKLIKKENIAVQCEDFTGMAIIPYKNNLPTYVDNISITKVTRADKLGIPRESVPPDLWNYTSRSVDVDIKSEKLGNIFEPGENPMFRCTLTDRDNQDANYDIVYTAKDEYGKIVWQKNEQIFIPASGKTDRILNLKDCPYGLYWLYVDITSDNHNGYSTYIQFSKANTPLNGVKNDRFNVCNHWAHGYNYRPNYSLVDNAGFGWVRDGGWVADKTHRFENGKLIVEEEHEKWFKYLRDNDIGLLYILGYGSVPGFSDTFEGLEHAAFELSQYFTKLGLKKFAFETYNEANHGGNASWGTAEYHAKTAMAISRGAKRANPDAIVVGGNTAGAPIELFKEMLEYFDGEKPIDALSIHLYAGVNEGSESGAWMLNANPVRELLDEYGYEDVELWVDETGWSTMTGMSTEKQAAQKIARMAAQMDAGIGADRVFWYEFQCTGHTREEREHNFGIIESYVPSYEHPTSGAARGAYLTISNYNALTSEADFEKVLSLGNNIYSYQYKKANGNRLVFAAAHSNPRTVGLKLDAEVISVYDLYGNKSELYPVNGIFNLFIGKDPVYIEGAFESVEICDPLFTIGNTEKTFAAGSSATVEVLTNLDGEFEVQIDNGGNTYSENTPAFADKKAVVQMHSSLTPLKNDMLGIKIFEAGKCVLDADITVAFEASVNFEKISVVDQSVLFNIRSANLFFKNKQTDLPVSGEIKVVAPEKLIGVYKPQILTQVMPNETGKVSFKIPEEGAGKELISLELTLDTGEVIPISAMFNADSAQYAKTKPKIDGVESEGEWNIPAPIIIRSADGAYGLKFGMMWDEEKFYFHGLVDDGVLMNHQIDPVNMWMQDSIQIALCSESTSSTFTELGVATSTVFGPVCYHWSKETGMVGEANTLIESAEVAIKRVGEQTLYEVAIPWKDIVVNPDAIKAGGTLKMDVLLNNDDASSRMMVGYNDCIANVKSTSGMAHVQLKK